MALLDIFRRKPEVKPAPADPEDTFDKMFNKLIERQEKLQKLLPKEKPVDTFGLSKIFEGMSQMDNFKRNIIEDYMARMPEDTGDDPADGMVMEIIKSGMQKRNDAANPPTPQQHLDWTSVQASGFQPEQPQKEKVDETSEDTISVPVDLVAQKLPKNAKALIKSGAVTKEKARAFAKELSDKDFDKLWKKLRE